MNCGDGSLAWKDIFYVGTLNDQSDERSKENIEDADLGLDFINDLRPRKFNKKDDKFLTDVVRDEDGKVIVDEDGEQVTEKIANPDYDENCKKYGIIAQEVIEVLKKHNREGQFRGISTKDPDNYQASYIEFIAPMMKAIQELSSKVTALENA